MFKSIVLSAALALSTLSFASAKSVKSYEVILSSPAKVGSMELKAGTYHVAVMDNTKVRFTDANGNAVGEANAAVTTGDKKFNNTLVDTMNVNGATQIHEIDLGGTKTKIQFEQ
jgi:hypothetical protein